MEVAIVRAPLMYGSGVRANFLRLMRWVDQERLLPLGAVANRRSLLNVWNLCDLLAVLLTHPEAAGRVWMASDGEDVSTPELIRRMARAMHRRARLVPLPISLLRAVGSAVGRRAEIMRLCGSLTVDLSSTRELLGWSLPTSVGRGLRAHGGLVSVAPERRVISEGMLIFAAVFIASMVLTGIIRRFALARGVLDVPNSAQLAPCCRRLAAEAWPSSSRAVHGRRHVRSRTGAGRSCRRPPHRRSDRRADRLHR